MAAPASAQAQAPAREPRQRQVVLPGSADEPVPEVRVAAGVVTYLRFDAPLDGDSVELEGRASRFRLVDMGERTLILEPNAELGAAEKLALRVRYRDGGSPASAALALVSHPRLVDKEVEVVRQVRTQEALEARLAQAEAELTALKARCVPSGLPQVAFSGLLGLKDIQVKPFKATLAPGDQGGLEPKHGIGYRAAGWAMVVIRVRNLPGQPAWAPATARLISAEGTQVKVHSVHLESPRLAPGESARVVVMADVPVSSESRFQLELVDAEGRRLFRINDVKL